MEFLLVTENLPFSVALAIMVSIAVLEGIGALFGLGVSTLLESLSPDMDFDIDGPDIDSSTTLTHFLSWLRIGKAPLLILIVVFLTAFSIVGLLLQQLAYSVTGSLFNGWLLALPALFLSLPCVRFFGSVFARIAPSDETEAVSEDSFIGRVAVIVIGTAKQDSPAEAKLSDEHDQAHYIMVEPDNEGEIFESSTHVLIVRKSGNVFKVIENPNESLI